MTRKKQRWALLILTAASLVPFYALQGMYTHSGPGDVPPELWWLETIAWSARAVIEIMAIGFLAETVTRNRFEAAAVFTLEVVMITLIALTGGVVTKVGIVDKAPYELLGDTLSWAWAFGMAAYAPLMVAAVSVGYKIMPVAVGQRQAGRKVSGKLPKADRPAGGKLTGKRSKRRQVGRKLVARPTSADQWNRKIPLAEVRPIVEANPNISGQQLADALGGVVSKTTANAMREDCLSIIAANGSGK